MNLQSYIGLAGGTLGMLSILFAAYNGIKKPQAQADKDDALLYQSVSQLQKDLANLRDNHVHTIDEKIDAMKEEVNEIKISVTKLGTILEERLPRKVL